MKEKGNRLESRAQDLPLSLQHRSSNSHKIGTIGGEHSADNNALKYNNPQNMYQPQINKRKAKEIKNLASKGFSPQASEYSFNKTPVKRLSRFERAECDTNSAEIETFETKSKRSHAPSPREEQKEQDENPVCMEEEWDDYEEVEDHEPEEKIPPLSPLKDEIIKYIEETNSFVFTSGKVMHYSTVPSDQIKQFVMRAQASRMK